MGRIAGVIAGDRGHRSSRKKMFTLVRWRRGRVWLLVCSPGRGPRRWRNQHARLMLSELNGLAERWIGQKLEPMSVMKGCASLYLT